MFAADNVINGRVLSNDDEFCESWMLNICVKDEKENNLSSGLTFLMVTYDPRRGVEEEN